MFFGEKILEYWDDILKDLSTLVSIPSVCGKPDGIYPYGKEPARAVDTALELAEKYGFKTKNVDYYAGHAEYGEGDESAVVMAHLDVVPAGEGWDTDPFEMVIKGDKAYGRGVADNKGAAVVALHCLRAIKDSGVIGRRKLKVIFGSGEEIGMDDMKHYFSQEPLPTMGFTPDAGYGICNCEKGILNYSVRGENDSAVIRSLQAGTVVNAVPYKAVCEINCTPEELEELKKRSEGCVCGFEFIPTEFGANITAMGKASHASRPQDGINAVSYLIDLLYNVFGGEKMGRFYSYAYSKIGLSTDGSQIGAAMCDEPSGPLTFNLGLVSTDENGSSLTVDIRYPATKDGNELSEILKAETEACGLDFILRSDAKPLYLPKESKLISILSGAYSDITGDECNIFSMGGGTYARTMGGKGVAFGPSFPGQESDNAHDRNENIDLNRFKLHAQICLEAMYRMFTAE